MVTVELRIGVSLTIQSVGGCNEGERDDSGEETHGVDGVKRGFGWFGLDLREE